MASNFFQSHVYIYNIDLISTIEEFGIDDHSLLLNRIYSLVSYISVFLNPQASLPLAYCFFPHQPLTIVELQDLIFGIFHLHLLSGDPIHFLRVCNTINMATTAIFMSPSLDLSPKFQHYLSIDINQHQSESTTFVSQPVLLIAISISGDSVLSAAHAILLLSFIVTPYIQLIR